MDVFTSLFDYPIARSSGASPVRNDSWSPLDDTLRALIDDLRRVVHSYLGLTLTLRHNGFPVTVTALEDDCDPAGIHASLRLPVNMLAEVEIGGILDLYAGRPGAFVDLAADVCHALRLSADHVVLDKHLRPPTTAFALTGARGLSHVNQAIGILVSHGQTPEDARTELCRRACHRRSNVPCVARELIRTTVHGPPHAMD